MKKFLLFSVLILTACASNPFKSKSDISALNCNLGDLVVPSSGTRFQHLSSVKSYAITVDSTITKDSIFEYKVYFSFERDLIQTINQLPLENRLSILDQPNIRLISGIKIQAKSTFPSNQISLLNQSQDLEGFFLAQKGRYKKSNPSLSKFCWRQKKAEPVVIAIAAEGSKCPKGSTDNLIIKPSKYESYFK